MSQARALVTGAASGIGQAAAKRLLDEGCSVIAVDINETGLDAVVADGAEPLVADLADLEAREKVIAAGPKLRLPGECRRHHSPQGPYRVHSHGLAGDLYRQC